MFQSRYDPPAQTFEQVLAAWPRGAGWIENAVEHLGSEVLAHLLSRGSLREAREATDFWLCGEHRAGPVLDAILLHPRAEVRQKLAYFLLGVSTQAEYRRGGWSSLSPEEADLWRGLILPFLLPRERSFRLMASLVEICALHCPTVLQDALRSQDYLDTFFRLYRPLVGLETLPLLVEWLPESPDSLLERILALGSPDEWMWYRSPGMVRLLEIASRRTDASPGVLARLEEWADVRRARAPRWIDPSEVREEV